MPKKVFTKCFTKFEWVCVALLEFKSRPGLDEGVFESYVHLNIVVPALSDIYISKKLNFSQKILLHFCVWVWLDSKVHFYKSLSISVNKEINSIVICFLCQDSICILFKVITIRCTINKFHLIANMSLLINIFCDFEKASSNLKDVFQRKLVFKNGCKWDLSSWKM